MSAYTTITLDSFDHHNNSIHPTNTPNCFRIDVPQIAYKTPMEIAITSFTYDNSFANVHALNNSVYIAITLPVPLFDDFTDEEYNRTNFPHDRAEIEWPVADPDSIEDWKNLLYHHDIHRDFLHTRTYEYHLPIDNYSSLQKLAEAFFVWCYGSVPYDGVGIPNNIRDAYKKLYGHDPLGLNRSGGRVPQIKGILLGGMTQMYLHDSLQKLLRVSESIAPADHYGSFYPYARYMNRYKQRNIDMDCYSHIFSLQRYSHVGLLSGIPREIVKFNEMEAHSAISHGELHLSVSCDMVKSTHVINNRLTRVLLTTRHKAKFKEIITIEPRNLIHLPALGNTINSIEVYISATCDNLPITLKGRSAITLRIQPSLWTNE